MTRRFLFLLLFSGIAISLHAAHIVGGEMTYRHLSGDEYEITIKLYRDCASGGARFDSGPGSRVAMHVTLFRDGAFERIINLSGPTIERINLGEQNPCTQIPPNLCVELGTYKFTINLPINNSTYTISYQRCCRNATIVNVVNPGNVGSTLTVDLNPEVRRDKVDSPTFNSVIPSVICLGFETEIDFSVDDEATGTRFEYELCTPFSGGTTRNVAPNPESSPAYNTLSFRAPYSEIIPMNSSPRFVLDRNTGRFIGRPTAIGQYVVGVCVYQYRGNTLLGTVRRDVQFNVTECNKVVDINVPNLDENNNKVLECFGLETTIVPEINDPRNVIESGEWEFTNSSGELINIPGKDFNYNFSDTGVYEVTFYVNRDVFGCDDSLSFDLEKRFSVISEFDITPDSCYENQLFIENNSLSNNADSLMYEWFHSDITGVVSEKEIPDLELDGTGNKTIRLHVEDRYGCEDDSALTFPYEDIEREFTIGFTENFICDNRETEILALYLPNSLNYNIEWDIDGDTLSGQRILYQFDSVRTYPVTITYTRDDNDCVYQLYYEDTINVTKSPIAAYDYSPKDLTYFRKSIVTNNLSEHSDFYEWKSNQKILGTDKFITYEFPDTGFYNLTLTTTGIGGCADSVSRVIDIPPFSIFHMPNAFTPNNDGENDEFLGKGVPEHLETFTLNIFSREGREVFSTDDPTEGWNGKIDNQGRSLPTGTYVWRINYQNKRGEFFENKGTVSLLR